MSEQMTGWRPLLVAGCVTLGGCMIAAYHLIGTAPGGRKAMDADLQRLIQESREATDGLERSLRELEKTAEDLDAARAEFWKTLRKAAEREHEAGQAI